MEAAVCAAQSFAASPRERTGRIARSYEVVRLAVLAASENVRRNGQNQEDGHNNRVRLHQDRLGPMLLKERVAGSSVPDCGDLGRTNEVNAPLPRRHQGIRAVRDAVGHFAEVRSEPFSY